MVTLYETIRDVVPPPEPAEVVSRFCNSVFVSDWKDSVYFLLSLILVGLQGNLLELLGSFLRCLQCWGSRSHRSRREEQGIFHAGFAAGQATWELLTTVVGHHRWVCVWSSKNGFINPFQSISDRWLGFLGFTIEISIDDNPSSYGHFYRWYRYIMGICIPFKGFLGVSCQMLPGSQPSGPRWQERSTVDRSTKATRSAATWREKKLGHRSTTSTNSRCYMTLYGYGSIPINTIFRGMNIHLPAILMFTRGTRFWHTAIWPYMMML